MIYNNMINRYATDERVLQ